MTTSSAQPNYSITSSDTITIGNVTASSTGVYYTGTGLTGSNGTITISNGGASTTASSFTISGSGAGAGGYEWRDQTEFVDCLPDFYKIQKMCEQYPGLKIAYEKFVTTYKLVKDHYDTPEDQRPLP